MATVPYSFALTASGVVAAEEIDADFAACAGVSGATISGHLAVIADTSGTINDTGLIARITPQMFGAKGDNSTDDSVAMQNFFNAVGSGQNGHIPYATYKINSQLTLNLFPTHSTGVSLNGDGMQRSVLNFSSVSGSPAMLISCVTSGAQACFYYDFRDFGLTTDLNGVGLQIGDEAFDAELNSSQFTNILVRNNSATSGACCIEANALFTCGFHNIVANCNASGDSLRLQKTQFSVFENCSLGGGTNALHFTNNFSFGNVFHGCDLESCVYCLTGDTAHMRFNTFVGGTWVWTGNCFNITASGVGNLFINGNLGSSLSTLFSSGSVPGAIKLKGGPGLLTIANPSVPSSGVAYTNAFGVDALVAIYSGAVTGVNIAGNALSVSGGSFVIQAGQNITLTYSSPPSWLWQPLL
jgi:hypothetical protein